MLENHAAYARPHLFSLCRMAWVDNLKRVGGCALHTGTSTWPAVTRRGVRTSKVDVISANVRRVLKLIEASGCYRRKRFS